MDLHSLLHLTPGASVEEIRDAYKLRVLELHPDRPNGNAQAFIRVHEAYSLLLRKCASSREMTPQHRAPDVRRPSSAARIPAMRDLRAPTTALIGPAGHCYAFETSPAAYRCSLRSGDLVRRCSDGTLGVIVGIATNGIHWLKHGASVTSLLGPTGMPLRGIAVVRKAETAAFACRYDDGDARTTLPRSRSSPQRCVSPPALVFDLHRVIEEEAQLRRRLYLSMEAYHFEAWRAFRLAANAVQ